MWSFLKQAVPLWLWIVSNDHKQRNTWSDNDKQRRNQFRDFMWMGERRKVLGLDQIGFYNENDEKTSAGKFRVFSFIVWFWAVIEERGRSCKDTNNTGNMFFTLSHCAPWSDLWKCSKLFFSVLYESYLFFSFSERRKKCLLQCYK